MIDYEITVKVHNLTEDEKKRVQDAFFKLGLTWWTGAEYVNLDKGCYTNRLTSGRVTQDLMWAFTNTKPTHTVDELLELAGMKTKADLKPFDLEKALKGEPVVLRNGLKAYVRHHETELDKAPPLIGFRVKGDSVYSVQWTECGNHYWSDDDVESGYDIVGMWSEPIVFKHWDLLSEDVKYLAKDDNGRWYGYSEKPYKDGERWGIQRGSGYSANALKLSLFPDCEWGESLIERPKKQRGEV